MAKAICRRRVVGPPVLFLLFLSLWYLHLDGASNQATTTTTTTLVPNKLKMETFHTKDTVTSNNVVARVGWRSVLVDDRHVESTSTYDDADKDLAVVLADHGALENCTVVFVRIGFAHSFTEEVFRSWFDDTFRGIVVLVSPLSDLNLPWWPLQDPSWCQHEPHRSRRGLGNHSSCYRQVWHYRFVPMVPTPSSLLVYSALQHLFHLVAAGAGATPTPRNSAPSSSSALFVYVDVEHVHCCRSPFLWMKKFVQDLPDRVFVPRTVRDGRIAVSFLVAAARDAFVAAWSRLVFSDVDAGYAMERLSDVLYRFPEPFVVTVSSETCVTFLHRQAGSQTTPLRSSKERDLPSCGGRLANNRHGDNSNSSNPLLYVDVASCILEEGNHATTVCASEWALPMYRVNPSGKRQAALQKSHPAAHAALASLNTPESPVLHRGTLASYAPSDPVYRVCPAGGQSAVLGISGGYHPSVAGGFIDTFLRATKQQSSSGSANCTVLVLFCSNVAAYEAYYPHAKGRVNFVDLTRYTPAERPSCPVAEQRMEIYYRWLVDVSRATAAVAADRIPYRLIAILDVRDVLFERDPFAALWSSTNTTMRLLAQQLGSSKSLLKAVESEEEWLLIPPESFPASHALVDQTGPKTFFDNWLDGALGHEYRKALTATVLDESTGEPMPVICSGQFLGTGKAMLQLLHAMFVMLKPTGCAVDQALLTMLVMDGLHVAGFMFPILLPNPEYSLFRNAYTRSVYTRWMDDRPVNCFGEPYAILHQTEPGRHHWMWNFLSFRDNPRGLKKMALSAGVYPAAERPEVARLYAHGCGHASNQERPEFPRSTSDDLILLDGHHWGLPYVGGLLNEVRGSGSRATVVFLVPTDDVMNGLRSQESQMKIYNPVQFRSLLCQRRPCESNYFFRAAAVYLKEIAERLPGNARVVVMHTLDAHWLVDLFTFIDPMADAAYVSQYAHGNRHAHSDMFEHCGYLSPRMVSPSALEHRALFSERILAFSSAAAGAVFLSAVLDAPILERRQEQCYGETALNLVIHFGLAPSLMQTKGVVGGGKRVVRLQSWRSEVGPVVHFDHSLCATGRFTAPVALCDARKVLAPVVFRRCENMTW